MLTIPLQQVPNQFLAVTLGDQYCELNIYQKEQGLFMDLAVNGQDVKSGILCHGNWLMIRYPVYNFDGDFLFLDTQGSDDPYYTGLGTRWVLCYYAGAELQNV